LIDADRQLGGIENHFDILLQKHIPVKDRADFIFHASDIWSAQNTLRIESNGPWKIGWPYLMT
jgi:hypothetical protein